MTPKELRQTTKQFQKLLGLKEWDIKVRFATKEELNPEDQGPCAGLCYYSPEYHTATVLIADPKDRDESDDPIETDIIHELLHLVIHGHKIVPDEEYDPMFERGLSLLSYTIYGLACKGKKKAGSR